MQKPGDDPMWDLVICITAGVGTVAWLLGALLTLRITLPLPWGSQFASLVCIILAVMMLGTSVSYWLQWKRRL